MPLRLDLVLRHEAGELDPTFRQAHGVACALLESADSAHRAHVKPFSVWPLLPLSPEEHLLRLHWLAIAPPESLQRLPGHLYIGRARLRVEDAQLAETSYAAMLREPPTRRVELRFRSPTRFRRNGRDYLLPDPGLLLGSLARRWDALCPDGLAVDPRALRRLVDEVLLARHRLQTELVDTGSTKAGFVGEALLVLPPDVEAEAAAVLGSLTAFAAFAGIGHQTTHGLGAVEVTTRRT